MKRKFTKLMAALALLVFTMPSLVAWGQTRTEEVITFSELGYENAEDVTTVEGENVTLTFAAGTNTSNSPKYYTTGTGVRMYANNTLTVYAEDYTITSITFTYSAAGYRADFTVNTGTYTEPDNEVIGSWVGSASSIVFTDTKTCRMQSVSITFTSGSVTTYTVTYDCNGGTTGCPDNVTDVAAGTSINLAAAPEKTDYTFGGWNDGTTTYEAGASYTVNSDVTLTAQWTENTTPSGDEQWVLTNLANLTENDVFVIVGNNGSNYAMSNNGGTGSAPAATAVTVANGMITSNVADNIQWTISGNATDGYTFYPNGSTTTWLYCTNTNNGVRVGTNTAKTFVVDATSGYLKHSGTSRYVGIYDSQDWRCYTSAGGNIANQTFAFYKKVTGGVVPPSIAAENVSIEYDATSGTITYTINNEPDPAGTLSANTSAEWLTIGTVGETVPFTCSANNTGTARTATVTLTYTYNREAVTKDVIITQAGDPNATDNISDITEAGSYVVKGKIFAKSSRGFVLGDGTGYVYVYKTTSDFDVNDYVKVSGAVTTQYNNIFEFQSSATLTEVDAFEIADANPTVMDGSAITSFVDYTGARLSSYVQYEGALAITPSGTNTYYNITIDGTDVKGSISYPTQDLSSYDGKNVVVIGYYVGKSTSNNVTYFNTMLESISSTEPSITVTPTTLNVEAGQHVVNDELTITFDNIDVVNYESFTIQFYNAEGEGQEMPEWLVLGVTGSNDEGYQVNGYISANESEARSSYFKVHVGETYSNLVTINQAAYVAPAAPGNWVLTDLTDLTENDVFVIVGTYEDIEHDSYAMSNDKGTGDAPTAVPVTVVDNSLSGEPDATIQWNLGITDDGYIFYPNGKTETWLYCTNSNNGVRVGTGNAKHFTLDDEFDGYLTTVETNDQRYIGIYNAQDWRCYKANQGEFPNNNIAGQSFAFYKRTVEPESYPLTINGYTDDNAKTGYNLIASPVTVNIADVEGMTEGDFDLYYYDDTQEFEWINYELTSNNFTQLVPGKGYLYAKKATTETPNYEFTLTGTPYTGTGEIDIIAGWNLVGNPYGVEAEISEDYYALDQDSEELIPTTAETHVAAMQGVFVHADNDDTVIFEAVETPSNGKGQNIALNVMKNRGNVIDRAIVRFGEGRQLPKFQLNPNSTKLYIPQGNKDYAIVRSTTEAEMPVNFKASENGTYTLAVEAENVEMNYLHLIDNMTGMDVDLLQTPNYTFEAKTSDYASRFRLVFSANGTTDNEAETFAYFNGSSWTVSNLGVATLQVVDVTGRTVSSEQINGNATISLNQTPGVYMFRLVSGNGVKVQKVVVK